jgi:NADPH:quinone reductase-like Zn-dependent oxidoreductase
VGGFAVQIARAWGARVVATASRGKLDHVRGLGADEVIDYRAVRFEDAVHDADVVFDLIGGDTQDRSWAVLKPGGFLVSAVAVPPPGDPRPGGRSNVRVGVRPVGEDLAGIRALIEAGRLRIPVERTYPLAEGPEAIEQVKLGHTRGKLVLVA